MKILLVLLLITSCSYINRDSRDYYEFKKFPKHGLVLVSKETDRYNSQIDQAAVARGQKIYERQCYECHGPRGEGDGPTAKRLGIVPQNLRVQVANTKNFEFYIKLSEWKGEMPGWDAPLTRQELKDLTEFLKTL